MHLADRSVVVDRVSPKTLLTFCTNGVLLRTLMAGEQSLSTVTHVIVVSAALIWCQLCYWISLKSTVTLYSVHSFIHSFIHSFTCRV